MADDPIMMAVTLAIASEKDMLKLVNEINKIEGITTVISFSKMERRPQ